MKRCAWPSLLALLVVLVPAPAHAVLASSGGLVVSAASVEVASVGSPGAWVPTSTVYEGSPARLAISVQAPSSGTVRTVVTMAGIADTIADASADVPAGASLVTTPLNLAYGAWLAGAVPNTADSVAVSVTFTPRPAPPAPSLPESAPTTSTVTTPALVAPGPAPPSAGPVAATRRVALASNRAPTRSAVLRALRTIPEGAGAHAIIRSTSARSATCRTVRELARTVSDAARVTGTSVAIRRHAVSWRSCGRLEIAYSMPLQGRMMPMSVPGTFSVPLTLAPRPVILVHGMWSSADTWSSYTRSGGFAVTANPRWQASAVSTMDTGSMFAPYRSVKTIAENAALAWSFIRDRMADLNAHEVDLVGHSMGGLIIRRILNDPVDGADAQAAVRAVVIIGTPNGGSSCSDAWSVPANRELTFTSVAAFNTAYPGYPGTYATALYSDHFRSTCFEASVGDLAVPAWSALAQPVNVARRIDPGVQHAGMTADRRLFDDYVLPALALTAAPVPGTLTTPESNPSAPSTKLDEGTASGSPLSVTRQVTIAPEESLVASVVADAGASGTLAFTVGGTPTVVPLVEDGDYPVFEKAVTYAELGGTSGDLTTTVTITATTSVLSPEWRWALAVRR